MAVGAQIWRRGLSRSGRVASAGELASGSVQVVAGGARFPALDGLRGVAALMVFLSHVHPPLDGQPLFGLRVGVWLFFALSGFLIYGQFARSRRDGGRLPVRPYLVRRFARIYPAYLVAAVGISLVAGWAWYLDDPLAIVLMTRTPISVVWTLALELQFYLLAPLLDLLVWRVAGARWDRGLVAIAAIGVGSLLLDVVYIVVGNAAGLFVHGGLLGGVSYLWAFVPGMLVAHVHVWRPDLLARFDRPVVAVGGVGLILLGAALHLWLVDPITVTGAALVIAWLIQQRPVAVAAMSVSAALSYSFYLWHEVIVNALNRPPTWLGSVEALAVAVAVAGVIYVVVERPAIRLGRSAARQV